MEGVLYFLMLVLCVPAVLWRAFVLVKLWAWFIIPTFALPSISYAAAIGLSLVVGYLTYQTPTNKDERDAAETFGATVAAQFLIPLLALLVGWIVQHWM